MMKKLQYGAFVRHIPGIYNSTWKDMFIETSSDNIQAAGAWTDRGDHRPPSDGEVSP